MLLAADACSRPAAAAAGTRASDLSRRDPAPPSVTVSREVLHSCLAAEHPQATDPTASAATAGAAGVGLAHRMPC